MCHNRRGQTLSQQYTLSFNHKHFENADKYSDWNFMYQSALHGSKFSKQILFLSKNSINKDLKMLTDD